MNTDIREERYAAMNRVLAQNQASLDAQKDYWKRTAARAEEELSAIKTQVDKMTMQITRGPDGEVVAPDLNSEDWERLRGYLKRRKELQQIETIASENLDMIHCKLTGDEQPTDRSGTRSDIDNQSDAASVIGWDAGGRVRPAGVSDGAGAGGQR
jgi:hypothetical protein